MRHSTDSHFHNINLRNEDLHVGISHSVWTCLRAEKSFENYAAFRSTPNVLLVKVPLDVRLGYGCGFLIHTLSVSFRKYKVSYYSQKSVFFLFLKKKKKNTTFYIAKHLLMMTAGDSDPLFSQSLANVQCVCVCAEHRLNCVRCEICMRYAWAKGHEEAGQPWAGLENLLSVHTHTQTGLH